MHRTLHPKRPGTVDRAFRKRATAVKPKTPLPNRSIVGRLMWTFPRTPLAVHLKSLTGVGRVLPKRGKMVAPSRPPNRSITDRLTWIIPKMTPTAHLRNRGSVDRALLEKGKMVAPNLPPNRSTTDRLMWTPLKTTPAVHLKNHGRADRASREKEMASEDLLPRHRIDRQPVGRNQGLVEKNVQSRATIV